MVNISCDVVVIIVIVIVVVIIGGPVYFNNFTNFYLNYNNFFHVILFKFGEIYRP